MQRDIASSLWISQRMECKQEYRTSELPFRAAFPPNPPRLLQPFHRQDQVCPEWARDPSIVQ